MGTEAAPSSTTFLIRQEMSKKKNIIDAIDKHFRVPLNFEINFYSFL